MNGRRFGYDARVRHSSLGLAALALVACVRTAPTTNDRGDAGAVDATATPTVSAVITAPVDSGPPDASSVDAGDLEGLAKAARRYLAAWGRGDADELFATSTPAMQSMVWKSKDGIKAKRAESTKACGKERSVTEDQLFVIDAARAYLRHFAVNERARCETTIYLDRASGKITGWLEWQLAPSAAPLAKAVDAQSAGRAYVKAFDEGAIELVWNASGERMRRDIWQSLGNLGGWQRTAMKTMTGTPRAISETVQDDHGRDRYEAVRDFGGRRFRTVITMDREGHSIVAWKTEPI